MEIVSSSSGLKRARPPEKPQIADDQTFCIRFLEGFGAAGAD